MFWSDHFGLLLFALPAGSGLSTFHISLNSNAPNDIDVKLVQMLKIVLTIADRRKNPPEGHFVVYDC